MARVLAVCTGNICRSPLAEMLLDRHLEGSDAVVESAGTHALVDTAMPTKAQALAHHLGVDAARAEAHAGRLLTAQMIDEADLIVTMSREQRRFIVENWPDARRKSFTIREFARLAAAVGEADLAALRAEYPDTQARLAAAIERVAAKRGRVAPAEAPEDDDVIDPYRRSRWVYRRSGQQLAPAAEQTADFVRSVID